MCGIIGFSGMSDAKRVLLDGLHALEYRGYDSAGISLMSEHGFETVKCKGRVEKLDELCAALDIQSSCGIGHTRWATHGEPSEANAHPHRSDSCVLVHNGIIENYMLLRNQLINDGYSFSSETDTECIVHLIDREYRKCHDPLKSIACAQKMLEGSYAFAVMFKEYENEIWACRRDNPLIAAVCEEGTYLASDIPALLPYTKNIIRPHDGDILRLDGKDITVYDENGNVTRPDTDTVTWNFSTAQKEGYEHFMLKEIYEQPKAIVRAISPLLSGGLPCFDSVGIDTKTLRDIDSISVIACGSATHAGLVAKFMIEQLAQIPVYVTTASEYRYCPPVTVGNTLTVAISQSGETADTLAALRLAKQGGSKTLGIINVVGSAIARESDYVIYTNAGPEIAVATTKGYTTQLSVLSVFAVALALCKGKMDEDIAKDICSELHDKMPTYIEAVLSKRDDIKKIAEYIYRYDDLYFIGRGIDNYAGIECSLKLKEISYIHSESYAAGELKHGTLSLIEKGTPVIALCCDEKYFSKMIGNIREVASRGGNVILVCSESFSTHHDYCSTVFTLPSVRPMLSALVSVVFSQLVAYETAILRDCDVDHPRNLAKSVTVE